MRPDFEARLEASRAVAERLVGLREAEASDRTMTAGVHLRVVHLAPPGEPNSYWLTADLRPDRVTLYVQMGKIVRADAG